MPEKSQKNQLFYGDNLDVLRLHVLDESVDLVYLDPPFNSNADYNVLFAERDGTQAAAQIKAFEDTWRWDRRRGARVSYEVVVESGGRRVAGDAGVPDVPWRERHARVSLDDGSDGSWSYVGCSSQRGASTYTATRPLATT